jgi:O-antigen/teichoic acid export membrane protein
MTTSSGFKNYFSNTAWMVGGRMAKALLNFAVSIFVARYLGPERFGVLNYAIGLALFFSIFCALGMDNILVRELVGSNSERQSKLMGSAFALRLFGSGIAFLLTIGLLAATHSDKETWILTVICSLSFLFLPTDVVRGFYEATVRGKAIVIVETVQCLLSSALRIYFIAVKGDVFWFSVCWLSEWVFTAVGFAVLYRIKDGGFSDWRFEPATLKHLFRESFPLLISAMAIVVYQQIDKIMLKNMLPLTGNEQVGYYSAALRIIPFVILIPQMMGKALVPSLINSRKHSPENYAQKAQLFIDLMTWMGIGLSVVLFLFAKPIMALYGPEYGEAVPLLRIVAWKGLFVAMSISSGLWIVTEGLQKRAVLRNLSGCLLNVALNWFWIPRWGAVGSAWATLFSFAVASFLIHAMIPTYRPVFVLQLRGLSGGVLRLLRIALRMGHNLRRNK